MSVQMYGYMFYVGPMSIYIFIWRQVLIYRGIYARSYVSIYEYMELGTMLVSRYMWSQLLFQHLGIDRARSYVSIQVFIWSQVLCRYLGIYGARSYVGIQKYVELASISASRYRWSQVLCQYLGIYMEPGPMSVSRYIWSQVLCRYLGIIEARSYVGIQVYVPNYIV